MIEQRVFIVDDDAAVCDSIRELMESVGLDAETYTSAVDFLSVYDPHCRGCLILDVRMAYKSGLDLQDHLNELGSTLPIIFVSGHADVPVAVQAMKSGAHDFLQKPYSDQKLLDSVNQALSSDRERRSQETGRARYSTALQRLTSREQDVLEQMLSRKQNKEIARDLGISPRTVEVHRHRVLKKFEVADIAELLLLADQTRILQAGRKPNRVPNRVRPRAKLRRISNK